jgi:hypothetical protein
LEALLLFRGILELQNRPFAGFAPDLEDSAAHIQVIDPIRRRLIRRVDTKAGPDGISGLSRGKPCHQRHRALALDRVAPQNALKQIGPVLALSHSLLTILRKHGLEDTPVNHNRHSRERDRGRMHISNRLFIQLFIEIEVGYIYGLLATLSTAGHRVASECLKKGSPKAALSKARVKSA